MVLLYRIYATHKREICIEKIAEILFTTIKILHMQDIKNLHHTNMPIM